MTTLDGTVSTFDSTGRLTTKRNRSNRGVAVFYDGIGRIDKVVHDDGPTLVFTYTSSSSALLSKITADVDPGTPGNETITTYAYDNTTGYTLLDSVTYGGSSTADYVRYRYWSDTSTCDPALMPIREVLSATADNCPSWTKGQAPQACEEVIESFESYCDLTAGDGPDPRQRKAKKTQRGSSSIAFRYNFNCGGAIADGTLRLDLNKAQLSGGNPVACSTDAGCASGFYCFRAGVSGDQGDGFCYRGHCLNYDVRADNRPREIIGDCANCWVNQWEWDTSYNLTCRIDALGERTSIGGYDVDGRASRKVANDNDCVATNPDRVDGQPYRWTTYEWSGTYKDLQTLVEVQSNLTGTRKSQLEYFDDVAGGGPERVLITQRGATQDINGTPLANQVLAITEYKFDSVTGVLTEVDGPRESPDSDDVVRYVYWGTGNGFNSFRLRYERRCKDAAACLDGCAALGNCLETQFTDYTGWGLPKTLIDPNGVTSSLEYDGRGRLKQVTRVLGGGSDIVTTLTYYPNDQLRSAQITGGTCRWFLYDTKGRPINEFVGQSCFDVASASLHIDRTYDASGGLTVIKQVRDGGTIDRSDKFEYDHKELRTKRFNTVDPAEPYVKLVYDAARNLTEAQDDNCVADPSQCGKVVYLLDGLQRKEKVRRYTSDVAWLETLLAFSPQDLVTQVTDSGGVVTTYKYDDLARMVEHNSPDSGLVRYAYDAAGNLTERREAAGHSGEQRSTRFSYDALHRVTLIDFQDIAGIPGQQEFDCTNNNTQPLADVSFVYDVCPIGQTCTNTTGRLAMVETEVRCESTLPDKIFHRRTYYGYDKQGRIMSTRVADDSGSPDVTASYTYRTDSQIATITYPVSGRVVAYGYDTLARINKITVGPDDVLTGIVWRAFGDPLQYDQANTVAGVKVRVERPAQLDESIERVRAGTGGAWQFENLLYGYDVRRLASSRDNLLDNGRPKDAFYQYDRIPRLTCDATASGACPTTPPNLKLNVLAYTNGDNRDKLKFANYSVDSSATDNLHAYSASPNRLASIRNRIDGGGNPFYVQYSRDAGGRRIQDDDTFYNSPHDDKRQFTYLPSGQLGTVSVNEPAVCGSTNCYGAVVQSGAYGHERRRHFKGWGGSGQPAAKQWYYYYDLAGRLIEFKYIPNTGTPTTFRVFSIIWLDNLPVLSYVDFYEGGTFQGTQRAFLQTDAMGVPFVATTWPPTGDAMVADQADMDSFGWYHPLTGNVLVDVAFRFPGQFEDLETRVQLWDPACFPNCPFTQKILLRPALSYNWHRTYDPYTGRYLEVDPYHLGIERVVRATRVVNSRDPAVGTRPLTTGDAPPMSLFPGIVFGNPGLPSRRDPLSQQPYVYARQLPGQVSDPTGLYHWTNWSDMDCYETYGEDCPCDDPEDGPNIYPCHLGRECDWNYSNNPCMKDCMIASYEAGCKDWSCHWAAHMSCLATCRGSFLPHPEDFVSIRPGVLGGGGP